MQRQTVPPPSLSITSVPAFENSVLSTVPPERASGPPTLGS